ncbi:hypothetical protein TWF696_000422 [Orbilia brochopaga]|uniref:BTB domain-containing protein n=1 Tax=Orbilia brochopaga TaxID=3140254 RepID=A0AAV9VBN5_9PEZI
MDPSTPSPQAISPGKTARTRRGTPSSVPAWNPAATNQALTPPPIAPQMLGMPKSPLGHPIPLSEHAVANQRKRNEESPLFRRSLIGRRPDSPTELATGGLPAAMKIPHGFENPGVRKHKGFGGLSQENSMVDDIFKSPAAKKDVNVHMNDGKDVMSDDGDDEWVDEEAANKPKVILDHAIMSSPIISLVLDHRDKSGHSEKVTFQVHKGLLANSIFLSACLGPDSTEIVLDSNLKPYAVSAVIQFLYSGDFTLEDKFQTVEDEEGYFEKLTNVEWTCCYLGALEARELALVRLESAYAGFEFRINAAGMAMRTKMTEWVYTVDEHFVKPGGKIQQLRQRVLAGWCRDLALIQQHKVVSETFENLLIEHPTLSFDLRQFLIERAKEDRRMEARLANFEMAELRGQRRYDHRRNHFFPELTRHTGRLQLPSLVLSNLGTAAQHEKPVETPMDESSIEFNVDPPLRKRATRVSDVGSGTAGVRASRLVLKTP